jgi:hypothetical protein
MLLALDLAIQRLAAGQQPFPASAPLDRAIRAA